jgi:hypothetical protein
MKQEVCEFLQEPGGKPKDDDQRSVGIANLTRSLQDQHLSSATAVDCGRVGSGAVQELAEETRHKPVLKENDPADEAKTAEHERRSAAARKAWITIRSNKAVADATRPASLITPTGKASGAYGDRPHTPNPTGVFCSVVG